VHARATEEALGGERADRCAALGAVVGFLGSPVGYTISRSILVPVVGGARGTNPLRGLRRGRSAERAVISSDGHFWHFAPSFPRAHPRPGASTGSVWRVAPVSVAVAAAAAAAATQQQPFSRWREREAAVRAQRAPRVVGLRVHFAARVTRPRVLVIEREEACRRERTNDRSMDRAASVISDHVDH